MRSIGQCRTIRRQDGLHLTGIENERRVMAASRDGLARVLHRTTAILESGLFACIAGLIVREIRAKTGLLP